MNTYHDGDDHQNNNDDQNHDGDNHQNYNDDQNNDGDDKKKPADGLCSWLPSWVSSREVKPEEKMHFTHRILT